MALASSAVPCSSIAASEAGQMAAPDYAAGHCNKQLIQPTVSNSRHAAGKRTGFVSETSPTETQPAWRELSRPREWKIGRCAENWAHDPARRKKSTGAQLAPGDPGTQSFEWAMSETYAHSVPAHRIPLIAMGTLVSSAWRAFQTSIQGWTWASKRCRGSSRGGR